MSDAYPFDVTVSIATYDRVALLEKTIASVLAQRTALTFEILVTDNHPSGNAEPLVTRLAAENPGRTIRYQAETTRNMSVLRNAGIKAARGAYVAFIDDDETAEPDWLDELMAAVRRTGADIAVGYRAAVFAGGKPPGYDPAGASFERTIDLPPDALIPLVRTDGKHQYGLGTGNSMFNAATCFRDDEPFSLAFGDAGGEDSEFFVRQFQEGRTIVWAPKAKVVELVAEHRTTVAYRLVRTRRETQAYVTTYVHHAPNPRLAWLKLTVKGVLQTLGGALLTLFTWEFGSERRLGGRLLLTHGLAKLQWRDPVGYIDETKYGA